MPAFTCDCLRLVCEFTSPRKCLRLRGDVNSTCVCQRLREQCLRSEKTSVARVAHVLLLRFVAGNVDVNMLASKRSKLIGNATIVRKRRVILNKSTCVCLRLPVAAITQKRRVASFDLRLALHSLHSVPRVLTTAMLSNVPHTIEDNTPLMSNIRAVCLMNVYQAMGFI